MDLMDIVDSDGYKIDDMAKAMAHSVFRLPPYNREVSPTGLGTN